jgi:poly-gamma-glutamate synthesis protein (capsule biosynthesis protein)
MPSFMSRAMTRPQFFAQIARGLLGAQAMKTHLATGATCEGELSQPAAKSEKDPNAVTLFLAGDVMSGRGIDQILPHPSRPNLYERYVRSALDYVSLAEQASGPIARPVDFGYIWGDALAELDRLNPDARIVNLETSVTTSDLAWPQKGVHYRMHPGNVGCLTAARLDCCVLANNHVLDWGQPGLAETLASLHGAGIQTAGAGANAGVAETPAIIDVRGGSRILVFAYAMETSGVPAGWAAREGRPGVSVLNDLSPRSVDSVARMVSGRRRPGDIAVMSIHWGGNWGYDISPAERAFAHDLIDRAEVDVVHGHSSHHVKGIEIHHDRPILYGCGDLLDDYEGIRGYDAFRADLALMYFPSFEAATGKLRRFAMSATRTQHLRINRAATDEVAWLATTLNREGRGLGTWVEVQADNSLRLHWN